MPQNSVQLPEKRRQVAALQKIINGNAYKGFAAMKQQGTLLLVDDDRHVLASMAEWLRELGYKVDTASNPAEALAAIARRSYDLALVDVRLGDSDGMEMLTHCRQHHPEMAVVMLRATPPWRRPSKRSAWAPSTSSPSR